MELHGKENIQSKQQKRDQQPLAAPCPECGTSVPWRKPQAGEKYSGHCSPCKTRLKNTRACGACQSPFLQERDGRVDYCQKCLGGLEYGVSDLLATYQLNSLGGIEKRIFKVNEVIEAERFLGGLGHVPYRIDLHDCLDRYASTQVLFDAPSMCISYVGLLSNKRYKAEEDIRERLSVGQLTFGCLVFRRGRGQNGNTFHEPGSKAWINRFLPFTGNAIFFDDSTDHYSSVKALGIMGLRSVLVTNKHDILDALKAARDSWSTKAPM